MHSFKELILRLILYDKSSHKNYNNDDYITLMLINTNIINIIKK